MNTADSHASYETVQVNAPKPVNARIAPGMASGKPVPGAKYPPTEPAIDLAIRLMLSGIPAQLVAELAGVQDSIVLQLSNQFNIGRTNVGLVFADVAARFESGACKAQIERDCQIYTRDVTDALYFYQLQEPPGRAADESWRKGVAEKYVNRVSLQDLAEAEGCSQAEVRAAVLFEGILLPAVPGVPISEQIACDVLHREGKSSERIAKLIGITPPAVRIILERYGHERRGVSAYAKFKYWDAAFLGDDPTDMYWLGFAFAEGHCQNKYKFCLSIMEADSEHLDLFCDYLKTNNYPRQGTNEIRKKYPGRKYKNRYVNVCNAVVVGNLLSRGFRIGERFYTMRDVIIEASVRASPHFMRGYFDGNGGISNKRRLQIGIRCPLKCVCDVYTKWLNRYAPGATKWTTKYVKRQKSKTCNTQNEGPRKKEKNKYWSLQLTGRRAQALINFMYFSDTGELYDLALARKAVDALAVRARKFKGSRFGDVQLTDILKRRARGEQVKAIAKLYACSDALISGICKGTLYKKSVARIIASLQLALAA